LAVLAYLLVTGAHPYLGQEQEDVRRRNFERGPIQAHEEASRRGRKEVPRAVSAVLARGLALGPEQRYSCITDFAREFRDAVTRFGPLAGVPRVFVSYRRQSGSGWANLITLQLKERHGIDAFLDTRALDSAGLFPERLRRAIESRDIFICLLAANTLESDHVRHEIRIAHANGKPMIPVLQESFRASDLAIPHEPHVEALLSHDGIQLLDERGIYIEQAIDEIARLVQRTLGLEGRTRE
jgi:hypothetical protein